MTCIWEGGGAVDTPPTWAGPTQPAYTQMLRAGPFRCMTRVGSLSRCAWQIVTRSAAPRYQLR
ncbi:hypothetical protein tb265_32980 [Gemmatimonadetes bacterium T265]|nr:hypothetical protein tb265_32980 [Gemmatimonadetes bacterium T265]